MTLPIKIFLATFTAIAFAIGLITVLDYFKFEKMQRELFLSKAEVIGADLEGDIENSIALGLSLPSIRNIPDLLTRASAADDDLLKVAVHDGTTVLASTEGDETGQEIPAGWPRLLSAEEGRAVSRTLGKHILVARSLENTFGQQVGSIIFTYSSDTLAQPVARMGRRLAILAGIAMAGNLLVSLLAAYLVSRSVRRACADLAVDFESLDGKTPAKERVAGFGEEARRFHEEANAKLAELNELAAQAQEREKAA